MPQVAPLHRRGPDRSLLHHVWALLALLALLALAGILSDSDSGDLVDLAALGALCATCWSPPPLDLKCFGSAHGLTDRELQVARCAATGSTNREISQHLGLSTRTVEGHLLRACEKIGVHTRVRLAVLMHSIARPHN